MSKFYYNAFFQSLDSSGVSIPGATLTFYEANTTTPKDTWQDAAFTIANTNPVVSDGTGQYPPIYLEDGLYTVVEKDADDVTLYTIDDLAGAGSGQVESVSVAAPVTDTGTSENPVIGVDASVKRAIALSDYHLLTTKIG